MRSISAWSGFLLILSWADWAAAQTPPQYLEKAQPQRTVPVPRTERRTLTPPVEQTQPPPIGEGNAGVFAVQVNEVLGLVDKWYVERVPRAKLAAAALKGLYEAAGSTPPTTLVDDVQKVATDTVQLQRFIAERRAKLGNLESLRGDRAVLASLRAVVKSLDPYSDVLVGDPLPAAAVVDPAAPRFGLELEEKAGALLVKTVALGSPAQKAGLRPGDRITHIDGELVDPHAIDAQALLQDDELRLRVERPRNAFGIECTLNKWPFDPQRALGDHRRPDNSWEYIIDADAGIAYIRLTALETNSTEELTKILENLQKEVLRGLILDLRWCPGGYLNDARAIAEMFLGEYSLAYLMLPTPGNLAAMADICLDTHSSNAVVESRPNHPDVQQKHATATFPALPLVVLVNGETTGGGELIAAVLQDNRRAFIMGQRTRGKGSVQNTIELGDGRELSVPIRNARLKITSGLLVRPNGKTFHRFTDSKPGDEWGVHPGRGLEFRVSPELNAKLHEWWDQVSLRPGGSTDSLPIDDPEADPLRQAAIKLLERVLRQSRTDLVGR
jgi:carboxyl-terminal processing protease